MVADIYQIQELNSPFVRFYSVKLGNNDKTEYADFVLRMSQSDTDKADLAELQMYILGIGNNSSGAELRFFKRENNADRIRQPTPETYVYSAPDPKDYGLRLFCIRLTDKVVVLFNGDRKTYKEVGACPNCQNYFAQANVLSISFDVAIHGGHGNIKIEDFDIFIEPDDFELNVEL